MNISKQAVLDVLKNYGLDDLDTAYLTSAINELPSISDGWISVGERYPVAVGYYLTWTSGMTRPIELYYENKFMTTNRSVVGVTHWQPLPNPPQK